MKPTNIIISLLVISNLFAISACNSKSKPKESKSIPVPECAHGDVHDHTAHVETEPKSMPYYNMFDIVVYQGKHYEVTEMHEVNNIAYYHIERDIPEKKMHVKTTNVRIEELKLVKRM